MDRVDIHIGQLYRVIDKEGVWATPGSVVRVTAFSSGGNVYADVLFGEILHSSAIHPPPTTMFTSKELEEIK